MMDSCNAPSHSLDHLNCTGNQYPEPRYCGMRTDTALPHLIDLLLQELHSWKLTWKPKRGPIKATVPLKWGYMGFHVSLGECTTKLCRFPSTTFMGQSSAKPSKGLGFRLQLARTKRIRYIQLQPIPTKGRQHDRPLLYSILDLISMAPKRDRTSDNLPYLGAGGHSSKEP